jgi:hypothetical protein
LRLWVAVYFGILTRFTLTAHAGVVGMSRFPKLNPVKEPIPLSSPEFHAGGCVQRTDWKSRSQHVSHWISWGQIEHKEALVVRAEAEGGCFKDRGTYSRGRMECRPLSSLLRTIWRNDDLAYQSFQRRTGFVRQ